MGSNGRALRKRIIGYVFLKDRCICSAEDMREAGESGFEEILDYKPQ